LCLAGDIPPFCQIAARHSLFGAENSLFRIFQGIDLHALVIAAEYRGV
jgi:hypothetical protein